MTDGSAIMMADRRVGWRRRPLAPAALAFVGLIVATAVAQAAESVPDRERLRQALQREYAADEAAYGRAGARADALRRENGELARRAREADERASAAAERIGELGPAVGVAAVRGPGIRVTLADPPTDGIPGQQGPRPPADAAPSGRLADHDLAATVNMLWRAGAEAIAVNGVRLTGRSAVRAAGDIILVDLRPVAAPYVVDAVGDPRALRERAEESAVVAQLRTRFGAPEDAVTVVAETELALPAAPVPTLRHIQGQAARP